MNSFKNATFKDLKDCATSGRTKAIGGVGRLIGTKTRLIYYYNPERIAVKYYSTEVLEIYPDRRIIINTSGYNTHTTKGRINSFLPNHARIFSYRGQIFYTHTGGWSWGFPLNENKRLELFEHDGKLLPENWKRFPRIIMGAPGKLPLGKRWYFVHDYADNSIILIHRCNRTMSMTYLRSTICSACNEDIKITFPDMIDRIKNILNFKKLQENLGVRDG